MIYKKLSYIAFPKNEVTDEFDKQNKLINIKFRDKLLYNYNYETRWDFSIFDCIAYLYHSERSSPMSYMNTMNFILNNNLKLDPEIALFNARRIVRISIEIMEAHKFERRR